MAYRVVFRADTQGVDVVVATLQTYAEACTFVQAIEDLSPRIEPIEATLYTHPAVGRVTDGESASTRVERDVLVR
jgi:hypothetical protein